MIVDVKQHPLAPWLVLLHSPGIGARRYARLLEVFGTPDRVLQASPEQLQAAGMPSGVVQQLAQPRLDGVARDLEWLDSSGIHHILSLDDPGYPALLKEIPDPPPVLFVVGDVECLSQPQLAVVGSRNPSRGGLDTAYEFACAVATQGLAITSGLALGIDAAAHHGALASSDGSTLAVMGTGPEQVYPRRHQKLAARVVERGALVTEFAPGTPAMAENFPRRNRIISGLGIGVLVVEANLKSGSLITARLAAEQGRDVFAVPGSIRNPASRGCHYLIRQGAKLVETVDDIWEEFSPELVYPGPPSLSPQVSRSIGQQSTPEMQQLLETLGFDPVTPDVLIKRSQLTSEQVCSILLTLELQGMVTALPGGYYCRRI